jgi:hypothetical protein
MAPTIVSFCPNIPLTTGVNPSLGYLLLESGDRIILEDGSGFLIQEGATANPISYQDESQLLIGCALAGGFSVSTEYYRRYLNDKGIVT